MSHRIPVRIVLDMLKRRVSIERLEIFIVVGRDFSVGEELSRDVKELLRGFEERVSEICERTRS
ncbi:MAG: hypothetical protein ABWJ42_04380 [Sulfolobales archaeon]